MRKMKCCKNNGDDTIFVNDISFRRYYHEGVPTSYFVSPCGKIYSEINNILLNPSKNHRGYSMCKFRQGKVQINTTVHKLVALVYIGPKPGPKYQIDHKDGNKDNNHYTNLEWVTPRENIIRSWRLGLSKSRRGDANSNTRYSDEFMEKVIQFLKDGGTIIEASDRFNIPRSYLYGIVRGNSRKGLAERMNLDCSKIYDKINGAKPRLTQELKDNIIHLKEQGMTAKEIQKFLGLNSHHTVYGVIYKRR